MNRSTPCNAATAASRSPSRSATITTAPTTRSAAQQVSRRVQAALMTLRPDYRAVIVLKHFLDSSYEDMSEILGIPDKTVKSRLFTARQALKEALNGHGRL